MNKLKTNKVGLKSLLEKDEDLYRKGGPFDISNPRSLINIAPEDVRKTLDESMPINYLYMSETELEERFQPRSDIHKIRIAFWKEYETAQSELRRMNLSRIALHLGQPSMYLSRVLRDPENLAVVLCPVTSYDNFLEEALMAGSKKLRQIIEMPLYDETGRPDHKSMEIVLKAVAFLDMRKHGGIVQKQLQVSLTKGSQAKLMENATLEELDEKIKRLEQKGSIDLSRPPELEEVSEDINAIEAEFTGKATGD